MEETPGYGRSERSASPGRGRTRRPALPGRRPAFGGSIAGRAAARRVGPLGPLLGAHPGSHRACLSGSGAASGQAAVLGFLPGPAETGADFVPRPFRDGAALVHEVHHDAAVGRAALAMAQRHPARADLAVVGV